MNKNDLFALWGIQLISISKLLLQTAIQIHTYTFQTHDRQCNSFSLYPADIVP